MTTQVRAVPGSTAKEERLIGPRQVVIAGEEERMVNCPLCDAVIDVDEEELDEGDALICEECGANLSVSGLAPLELSPEADDEDDDEDVEDDDFDDDEDEDEEDEEEEEDEWK